MNNKIALISGGLGEIGNAIALLFGQQGVKVAIGDIIDEETARPHLEALRSKGCKNLFYQKVDVTAENEVANWLKTVEGKWGIAQIIVPNAGIVVAGALTGEDLKTEDVHRQMDVNFWGSYHLSVQAAKRLRENSLPGRITFMGSWAAERPTVRISSYCISKAAVRMLCKTLALDLAKDDILVNEIAPGIVEGGLSKKNQQKDPELLKTHLNSTPVHKLIPLKEIAKHVLMMSDFKTTSLTGTTVLLDGGLSLTSKMTPDD